MPLSSFLCCHTPNAHMTGVFLTGRGLSARQNKKGLRLNWVNTLWTVCYRVYFITKKPTTCTECAKLYILWEKHSKNFIMMCCWTSLHRLWPYPLLVWSAICECVCVCASVCVCVWIRAGREQLPSKGRKRERDISVLVCAAGQVRA